MTRRSIFLLAILLFFARDSGLARADSGFRVIVNSANPVASIRKDQLGQMLLKSRTSWSNGNRVLPVDQRIGSHVRDVVSNAVHGRSASVIKNWWNQQIFAGKGVPPPELATDAKVVAYVSANPGAVGYVSIDAPIGDTRAVTITEQE